MDLLRFRDDQSGCISLWIDHVEVMLQTDCVRLADDEDIGRPLKRTTKFLFRSLNYILSGVLVQMSDEDHDMSRRPFFGVWRKERAPINTSGARSDRPVLRSAGSGVIRQSLSNGAWPALRDVPMIAGWGKPGRIAKRRGERACSAKSDRQSHLGY
jgi:hypothetical protein